MESADHRATIWMRRIARIWYSPIILYAMIMLVGYAWNWVTTGVADPYTVDDYPPVEVLPPIFMFLSVMGLGIAWWREGLGGVVTIVFQASAFTVLLVHNPIMRDFPRFVTPYFISIAITVPGIMFLVYWVRMRRR